MQLTDYSKGERVLLLLHSRTLKTLSLLTIISLVCLVNLIFVTVYTHNV